MKYECVIPFDACNYLTVEADSPEAAAQRAMSEAGSVTLCHQCSDKIDIADAQGVIVTDEEGTTVFDDTWSGQRIRELEAKVAALEAELAASKGPAA